jgi:signal peptide peptidase-like protein 2B
LGEVSLYTAISFGVGLVLVVTWVLVRNSRGAWLLQDFLGVLLLILLQQSIRLPDIKVSAILLCMAFLYDVFWVFLSGYFFRGSSVMITVARGGDTGEAVPMLLRLPRENDELGGGYSMLGLGDMALPGLLVSYLLRFDLLHLSTDPILSSSWTYWFKNSYFVLSSLGYMAGLAFTYVVLMVTQSGQPALLYLVPTTLGLVVFVAHRRGELAEMWHGGERCGGPPPNRANGSAAVAATGGRSGASSSSSNGIGGVLSASPRSRSPRRTGGGGGGGSYASVASHVVPPSGAEEDEELELDGDAAMVNDESQLALEDREMMNNL